MGAANFNEAIECARKDSPEMAVLDLRMPGQSGLELLKALLEIDPATKIVMLTGYGSIATAIDAVRLGATHYLPKPADVDDILAGFNRAENPPLEPPEPEYVKAPSLARTEWEHINRVLSDCGGNISESARRLGIHRSRSNVSCKNTRLIHKKYLLGKSVYDFKHPTLFNLIDVRGF